VTKKACNPQEHDMYRPNNPILEKIGLERICSKLQRGLSKIGKVNFKDKNHIYV